MTIPASRIGDKGQRYEVRAVGYPKSGENTIGWAGTYDGAWDMARSIKLAPSCVDAYVFDREMNVPAIKPQWWGITERKG